MEKLICIAACFASRWTEVSLKCTDWWQARADARRVCPSEQEGTGHDFLFLFLFNLMRRLQLARPGLRSCSAPPKSCHDILFSWALEGSLLHFLGSSQKLFSPILQEVHFLTDPLLCWWQKEILLSQNIQMMVSFYEKIINPFFLFIFFLFIVKCVYNTIPVWGMCHIFKLWFPFWGFALFLTHLCSMSCCCALLTPHGDI